MTYIESWEEEKKKNLLEAFVRVMQGEPADGGNSAEETREYLLEFEAASHLRLLERVEEEINKNCPLIEQMTAKEGILYLKIKDLPNGMFRILPDNLLQSLKPLTSLSNKGE